MTYKLVIFKGIWEGQGERQEAEMGNGNGRWGWVGGGKQKLINLKKGFLLFKNACKMSSILYIQLPIHLDTDPPPPPTHYTTHTYCMNKCCGHCVCRQDHFKMCPPLSYSINLHHSPPPPPPANSHFLTTSAQFTSFSPPHPTHLFFSPSISSHLSHPPQQTCIFFSP